jgi:type IV pilus assembly protein PilC
MSKIDKQTSTFHWTGINIQGKKSHGEMSAKNKISALSDLKNHNISLIKLHKKKSFPSLCRTQRISKHIIVIFFRQLATLMTASIPLVQCFIILNQTYHHNAFKSILASIKVNLEAGKTLSLTLSQFPLYFDYFTCQLIHVGEQTGTLTIMLNRIAKHKENMQSLKNKCIQSLYYPIIIFIVANLITLFMLVFIVPRFAQLFQEIHGTLPVLTLFVIHLSEFIRYEGWLIIIPIAITALIYKYFNQSQYIKYYTDRLILKIPLIGNIVSKIILAHFARSLAIAFKAGIPILQALAMLAEQTRNQFYQPLFSNLQTEITKGRPLHKAMHNLPGFPVLMVQMVKIGEESGKLDELLEKISDLYESDIDNAVISIASTLEPLIMVILGVLIGVLVIAMYLPIFKLGTLM